jgi:hypothetical protein
MTRTPTLPYDDRSMWRRLVSRSHPDAGGDHELFIWTVATRDAICGGELGSEILRRGRGERAPRSRKASTSRVAECIPFDGDLLFEVLTACVLATAEGIDDPYSFLLRQVADCYPAEDGPLHDQQCRGASYRSLAAIGHQVGMSKGERVLWYRIAETIPLSQRHAGHILSRIKRQAA